VDAQLDLLDSRTSVVQERAREQTENLDRVRDRIAAAVLEFASLFCGVTFHAEQLHRYVSDRVGKVAPGSADRILRHLKQKGLVNYTVVDRARSLYRVGA
jgi:DNA-binding PadR family transcriptional regulator